MRELIKQQGASAPGSGYLNGEMVATPESTPKRICTLGSAVSYASRASFSQIGVVLPDAECLAEVLN